MAPAERSLSLRRSSRARGGKEYGECGQILLIVPRQTRREPDQAPHANFHRGGCQADRPRTSEPRSEERRVGKERTPRRRRPPAATRTGIAKKKSAVRPKTAPADGFVTWRRSTRARGGNEYGECGQILLIVPRQTRREPDQAPHANFHRGGCQADRPRTSEP